MDRFLTYTSIGPSAASISKQKALDTFWLEHYKVTESLSRSWMCVKSVHRRRMLKANAEKILYTFHTLRAILQMESAD